MKKRPPNAPSERRALGRGALWLPAIVVISLLGLPLSPVRAAGPGYVTLQFGRGQWVTTDLACVPRSGAVSLEDVAVALRTRGMVGTATVVVNRTRAVDRLCWSQYTLQASWADLTRLRDDFGWEFVSGGMTHNNITTMTPDQQREESCGSLSAFTNHGHTRAWGLFGYGNNKSTYEIQRTIVASCFAYGRTYSGGRNVRSRMAAPWFQKTNSINGGKCNEPALPCYTMTVKNDRRYTLPTRLVNLMNVGPDEWVVIQMYRFATGARLTGSGQRWDCSSSDWTKHWTSDPEMYCFEDYLYAIDRIPLTAVVTDPATVAEAWGRRP